MKTPQKTMAMGLALSLALATPCFASTVLLPTTLDGNFAILNDGTVTFTGDRSISGTVTIGVGAVEYLVIGGGGGGGRNLGGGGGAGAFLTGMATASPGSTDVVVGALGTGGNATVTVAGDGGLSRFGSIEALGGGGGGNFNGAGRPGASGGGGANVGGTGATGTQGNNGGDANGATGSNDRASGGGGGGGGPGANGTTAAGGSDGGAGLTSSITGMALGYAGGGGGGRDAATASVATHGGGAGGWGTNAAATARPGSHAVANTGGGGGGGARNNGNGGNGGSGVVHLRYAGDGAVATGGTVTQIGGTPYTLHSYTSTGSSSFALDGGFDPAAQHAIFSGDLSGSGGLNIVGPGMLTLTGTNSYSGLSAITGGTLVVDGTHSGGGAYTVEDGAAIGGGGTIGSALTLNSGANFWWDGSSTLTVVDGNVVTLNNFGISSLVGFDWSNIGVGIYTLVDNDSDFENMGISNWGLANAYTLADGRRAYFSQGSLLLTVTPEPSTALLSALGLLALLGGRRRR